jgi:hypothetical protein
MKQVPVPSADVLLIQILDEMQNGRSVTTIEAAETTVSSDFLKMENKIKGKNTERERERERVGVGV